MNGNRTTSAEAANLAEVSHSWASIVFTPLASASQTTIDKVRILVNYLSYNSNFIAQKVISNKYLELKYLKIF